jgi:pimeloyl-ACP methyl ester carboxylesterase
MEKNKTFVIIHGALGNAVQMAPLRTKLASTYNCYSYDIIGHGLYPSQRAFDLSSCSKQLISILEELKTRSNIFAYSMGGYIATSAALKRPELFESITCLATKWEWSPEIALRETKMLQPELIESKVPQFAEILANRYGADWKSVVQATANFMRNLGDGKGLDLNQLSTLTCPINILRGTLDKMVGVEESLAMVELLPNSEYVEIEGMEHPWEKVDLDVLSSYLAY